MLWPARSASSMAFSFAKISSAARTASASRSIGITTTPFTSATTTSPGRTGASPSRTGTFQASCTMRPRAVLGTVPRACTAKPKASQASTSRTAPSTTTPATPLSCAANARISPQQLWCKSPRLSTTITSPGTLAAIASTPKCATAGTAPAAVMRMVTARPITLVRPQRGVMPATAARATPRRSSASLRFDVARAARRGR